MAGVDWTDSTVEAAGTKLHVSRAGRGQPVLVLHHETGTLDRLPFYDALAGSSEDSVADPKIAEIARALVRSIKEDLSVDWADHESTEAAIRTKIKQFKNSLHLGESSSRVR